MIKILKIYVIAGCILQFLIFHLLQTVAKQTILWFAQNDITQISLITSISLHIHPFLNAFTLALWLFVIYALLKKKSEMFFAHILGIILLSSLGIVVFQAFGIAIVFMGTMIGQLK